MLDIEFAIDNLSFEVNLLQVRRITTQKNWIDNIDSRINQSLESMKDQVGDLLASRQCLWREGNPWKNAGLNPAEIIGTAPRLLAYLLRISHHQQCLEDSKRPDGLLSS